MNYLDTTQDDDFVNIAAAAAEESEQPRDCVTVSTLNPMQQSLEDKNFAKISNKDPTVKVPI